GGGSAAGGGAGVGGGAGAGLGGAIFNLAGTVTLINSTLTGNTAQGGSSGGSVTFPGNGGSGLGGALFNLDGTLTLTACTVAGNTVGAGTGATAGTAAGGALYSLSLDIGFGVGGAFASVTLANSILAGTAGGSNVVNEQRPVGPNDGFALLVATTPNLIEQPVVFPGGRGAVGATSLAFSGPPRLRILRPKRGLTPT